MEKNIKPKREIWEDMGDRMIKDHLQRGEETYANMIRNAINGLREMTLPVEGEEFDAQVKKLAPAGVFVETEVMRLLSLRNAQLEADRGRE